MDKHIKDYMEKELKYYVIGNVLLILITSGFIDTIINPVVESTQLVILNDVFSSAFFSALAFIYVFILDSLVPPHIKDKLLWLAKGKPGETIFTDIKKKNNDDRFLKEDVINKYADIYQTIEAEHDDKARRKLQNAYWYKIYKVHEKEESVYASQRDSLLSRDMSIITLWIIIGYVIVNLFLGVPFHCGLIILFFFEMVITRFVARSKVKRFVYNVIAADVGRENR